MQTPKADDSTFRCFVARSGGAHSQQAWHRPGEAHPPTHLGEGSNSGGGQNRKVEGFRLSHEAFVEGGRSSERALGEGADALGSGGVLDDARRESRPGAVESREDSLGLFFVSFFCQGRGGGVLTRDGREGRAVGGCGCGWMWKLSVLAAWVDWLVHLISRPIYNIPPYPPFLLPLTTPPTKPPPPPPP